MAREIEKPDSIIYSVELKVPIFHINYGNHLGADGLVSLIHEARMQFLLHFNHSEINIDGASLIIRKLTVEYMQEIKYGELLNISIGIGKLTKATAELVYQINRENNTCALASTVLAFVDKDTYSILTVPIFFQNNLL